MNIQGTMHVEVIDMDGRVIESSESISADSTRRHIPLACLARVAGTPVRLRFEITDGAMFSFWVTEDPSGSSGGYVGAGGA